MQGGRKRQQKEKKAFVEGPSTLTHSFNIKSFYLHAKIDSSILCHLLCRAHAQLVQKSLPRPRGIE